MRPAVRHLGWSAVAPVVAAGGLTAWVYLSHGCVSCPGGSAR